MINEYRWYDIMEFHMIFPPEHSYLRKNNPSTQFIHILAHGIYFSLSSLYRYVPEHTISETRGLISKTRRHNIWCKYCVLYGCNEYENNFVPWKYEIYIKTTVNIELMSALAVYLWVKILPSKCWPSLNMSVLITASKWSTVPLLCQDLEPFLFFKILVILFMQMQMCIHQLLPATKVLIHTGPAFGHHYGSRWVFCSY